MEIALLESLHLYTESAPRYNDKTTFVELPYTIQ